MFVGQAGKIMVKHTTGDHWLITKEGTREVPVSEPVSAESPAHHQEWINACKHGGSTSCHFGRLAIMTETILLGNVAYRVGRKIEWDAEGMKAIGCPEADPYLRPEYRAGWTL
jgi:hypothetical protein